MIRYFGAEAYPHMIRQPRRLILRAIEIEDQREEARRYNFGEDLAMAAGTGLGKQEIDPKTQGKKRSPADPYVTFEPFVEHQRARFERAYPWLIKQETPEEREKRLDLEQDLAFRRAFNAMQA